MPDINDPTKSTSASLSREAFIGLSAGAGLIAANVAGVEAGEVLGTFHKPLVPENDPSIDAMEVKLQQPDALVGAYAAMPKSISATTPGVVVVQHIWGVDAQIRDVVRRFAKAGYVTIAPELYARLHAPNGDMATDYAVFAPFAGKLGDQALDDLVAGAAWIRKRAGVDVNTRPPKVAITGFCMGGIIAMSAAAKTTVFDACAIWYGKPKDEYADMLKIPTIGSYGERDSSIPPASVREFQHRLHVANNIKIYPEAGHAFFDDQRKSYVPSAAADAWRRTLAWFEKYLAP